ncbi:MAG: ferritin family protein [Sporolactobacillus sp.]
MYYDDQQYRQMSQDTSLSTFTAALLDSVKGEAAAVDFYTRLAQTAPNSTAREDILHIIQDEQDHFRAFSQLYVQLTGTQPSYQITPVQFNTYMMGLRIAYRDELEDYEKYRNYYLMTQDQAIRDIFFRAFSDEIKHAIRFGFLTTSLS